MLKDTYITLQEVSEGAIYKDKGSKFLGYAYPITSEEDVKPIIAQLKREHHAARRWCYAWQLGVELIRYRANDDGEPSNSAGKPIYGQIISKNLTDVLIIVVRYYGGINLGVGGLIQAYRSAAKVSLESAKLIKKTLKNNFELQFEYKDLNKVMRIIKDHHIELINKNMNLSCELEIAVRKSEALKVKTVFDNLYGIKITQLNLTTTRLDNI